MIVYALIGFLVAFPVLPILAAWLGVRDGYSGGRHRDVTG